MEGTKGGEPKTNDQFCQTRKGNLTGLGAKTGLFARFIFVHFVFFILSEMQLYIPFIVWEVELKVMFPSKLPL